MTKNRDKLEIVCDVLKTCREPVRKTRIMGSTNLNYAYVTSVIRELVQKRMLASIDGKYSITPHGLEFLENLEHVLSMWHGLPVGLTDIEAQTPQMFRGVLERVNRARPIQSSKTTES